MKKIILSIMFAPCLLPAAYCQLKITNASSQKIYGGIGGITMGYAIEFTNKNSVTIEIDSVKSIAGKSMLDFYFHKNDKGTYDIHFSITLKGPEKCRTCPDMEGKQIDLRKGVVVYYKKDGKISSCKVKKFKQLPDIMSP